jgi:peptidoglycan/xylan/chitin deacetylase (PgdA/CDA1 family)
MKWLRDRYRIKSVASIMRGEVSEPAVALTFDDGYASWYENAVPILEKLGIPAVFFVCSGLVGLRGDDAVNYLRKNLNRNQNHDLITRKQVQAIAKHPLFEIGGHTVNHLDLGDKGNLSLFRNEILSDKAYLEDVTGKRIKWFSYPFGMRQNISAVAIDFVKEAGYEAAFSFIPGAWDNQMNRYMIYRDGLNIHDSNELWSAWLDGAYDRLYAIRRKIGRATPNKIMRHSA